MHVSMNSNVFFCDFSSLYLLTKLSLQVIKKECCELMWAETCMEMLAKR